jgi:hypothetical protein
VTPVYSPTYFQYYNGFKSVATQPNQLTALASLGPAPINNSSGNPVNGNTSMNIGSAEGRNIGLNTPGVILPNSNIDLATTGGTFDGEIGLATGITFPPATNNGSNFSLQAVATHEIDEVLGIGGPGSTLSGSGSLTGPVGALDLYRYDASGSRSYSNNDPKQPYFSINGELRHYRSSIRSQGRTSRIGRAIPTMQASGRRYRTRLPRRARPRPWDRTRLRRFRPSAMTPRSKRYQLP